MDEAQIAPPQIEVLPSKKGFFSKKLILPIIVEVIFLLIVASSAFAFYYFKTYKTIKVREASRVVQESYYTQKIFSVPSSIINPSILQMSKDETHIAFNGSLTNGNQVVVIDGKKSKEYTSIASLTQNEISNKLVFVGHRLATYFVVNDLVEDRPYDMIFGDPVISPDGQHVAYIGRKSIGRVLVVDGKEKYITGGPASSYVVHKPKFSPDSQNVAFVVEKTPGELIATYDIKLGKAHEGKLYDRVTDPVYGITGSYAYKAEVGKQDFAVVNDVEGTRFDVYEHVAWEPVFSPDGKHIAYSVVLDWKGRKAESIVLDNFLLPILEEGFLSSTPQFSDDGKNLLYITKNKTYTYDASSRQIISEITPTPMVYRTNAEQQDIVGKHTAPNGQVYYMNPYMDDKLAAEITGRGIKVNESNFLSYSKVRLRIPNVGEIIADKLSVPNFSSDGKYFTVTALRGNDLWHEAYKIDGNKLIKMPVKAGNIINFDMTNSDKVQTNASPIITEKVVTLNTESNMILFDLEYNKKEGSRDIVTVFIDGTPAGSIYEEDIPTTIAKNATFSFPTIQPGLHKLKFYAEPLNKDAKSAVTATNFRFGFYKQ